MRKPELTGIMIKAKNAARKALGLPKHQAPDEPFYTCPYGNEDDKTNEVPVPASAGDLIVHDSLTIHLAGKNLSNDRPRRAIGFIFYSSEAKENSLQINEYKEKLRDQQMGKI